MLAQAPAAAASAGIRAPAGLRGLREHQPGASLSFRFGPPAMAGIPSVCQPLHTLGLATLWQKVQQAGKLLWSVLPQQVLPVGLQAFSPTLTDPS